MNRARVRIAILAIPLAGLGVGLGCVGQVDHSYFDDLLDGSTDGTITQTEASTGSDSSVADGQVVTGDDASDALNTTGDATDAADAADATDATDAADAPADAQVRDTGFDAPDVADSAPVEAGCGPTTTVTNCGQCGAACDTTHGSPTSCTAGACKYTCNAGFGDCQPAAPDLNGCETPLTTTSNCGNCGVVCDSTHSTGAGCNGTTCAYSACQAGWSDCKKAAPNADGCECNSPACCDGGACQAQHNNGIGQSFYDCTPLGQYNSALALAACTAYTGNAALCAGFSCKTPGAGPIICSSNATTQPCLCWSFGGSNVGLVDNGGPMNTMGTFDCFCPSAAQGDTPWQ